MQKGNLAARVIFPTISQSDVANHATVAHPSVLLATPALVSEAGIFPHIADIQVLCVVCLSPYGSAI